MLVRSVVVLGAIAVSASAVFGQPDNGGAVTRPAAIMALLTEAHSPTRDRHLYDLAVETFRDIEAGIADDIPAARKLMHAALREAAQGGLPEAWVDYGRCLWNGWGTAENREEALAAYRKAADLGSDYGAYLVAHNLYWTFKRYDEAHAYALRAVKGEDPAGEARYLLALMVYNGRGRQKDVAESLRLHQEAAARGNPDALFELFVYAMNGIGEKQKAVFYLKEAATREQPRAMANLGALHATGRMAGIERSAQEAVKWYRRAADKGIGRAAAALGVMAMRGDGMPKDPDAAKAFFARAEALGFELDDYLEENGIERP
jgi:TPR repeat protein